MAEARCVNDLSYLILPAGWTPKLSSAEATAWAQCTTPDRPKGR